jgi:hypothetical protein
MRRRLLRFRRLGWLMFSLSAAAALVIVFNLVAVGPVESS